MSLVICEGCGEWVSLLVMEDCQRCYDVIIDDFWPYSNDNVY